MAKTLAYNLAAYNEFGQKYIIRSKCCLAKVFSAKLICGDCEMMPCQPITFFEEKKQ